MPEECIHGFEAGLCDVCYPKAPPAKPARSRPASRPASTTGTRSAAARVQTQRDRRVYHVIGLTELDGVIAAGGIEGEPRWRAEAAAWRRDDVVLVASVTALGATAVAVGDEVVAEGLVPLSAVQAIGVASEPVRDAVRELLRGVDAPPRILVYPPWFTTA